MTNCSYLQKLNIYIDNIIDVSSFNLSTDYYDSINNLIFIYVDPSAYQTVIEGDTPRFINTASLLNPFITQTRIRKGFTVNLSNYSDAKLFNTILLLTQKAIEQERSYIIRDYLSPEPSDFFTTGYTDRVGLINLPINYGGLIRHPVSNKPYLPDGFSFTFMEKVLRNV